MTYELASVLANFKDAYQFLWDTSSLEKKEFIKKNKFSEKHWDTTLVVQYLDIATSSISERVSSNAHIFAELGIYTKDLKRFFPVQAVVFLSLLSKGGKGAAKSYERRKLLGYYSVSRMIPDIEKCLGVAPVVPVDVEQDKKELLEAVKEFATDFGVTYDSKEVQQIKTVSNSLVTRIEEIKKEYDAFYKQLEIMKKTYLEEENAVVAKAKELKKEYDYLIKHV